MEKFRDTTSASEQTLRPTASLPQKFDEAAEADSAIASTSNIEERFANWGTD